MSLYFRFHFHSKSHIQEKNHKNKTINYCHVCKLFCANKENFIEHRIFIAHKIAMAELEKPFVEPEVEEVEPAIIERVKASKTDDEKISSLRLSTVSAVQGQSSRSFP